MDSMQSLITDDEAAFERNMKKLASELSKPIPKPDILKELMRLTFMNRRMSVLSGEIRTVDLCEKYPLLRKPKHVSCRMELACPLNCYI